jgi:hypothetical protein
VATHGDNLILTEYLDGRTRSVFRISDAANPVRVNPTPPLYQWEHFAGSGDYLYALEGQTLQVIDAKDAVNPRVISTSRFPSDIWAAALEEGRLYLARAPYFTNGTSQGGGLDVIDISEPGQPRPVGHLDSGTYPAGLAVRGSFAYLLERQGFIRFGPGVLQEQRFSGKLRIIDISVPSRPRQVGTFETYGIYSQVTIQGDFLLLTGEDSIAVLNVSDSANPKIVGGVSTRSDVRNVTLRGDYAYVADGVSGLDVLEITNRLNPTRVANWFLGFPANGVSVSGNIACVSALGGLHLFDISDPHDPRKIGEWLTPGNVEAAIMRGNYAFMATVATERGGGGLQVLDISNLSNLRLVASYGTSVTSAVISDNYLYLSPEAINESTNGFEGGIHVLDIANPEHPQRKAVFPTEAQNLYLSNNYLYAAGRSLEIFDIRNPTTLALVGRHAFNNGFSPRLTISGDLALLTEFKPACEFDAGCFVSAALVTIDVQNPARSAPVGGYLLPGFDPGPDYGGAGLPSIGATTDGELTYFAAGKSGLLVLGKTPSNPQSAGRYASEWPITATAFGNGPALLAESKFDDEQGRFTNRIQILDLADPSSPGTIAAVSVPWPILNMALLSTNHVFVLEAVQDDNGESTLIETLDISNPSMPMKSGSYKAPGPPAFLTISEKIAYLGIEPYSSGNDLVPGEIQILDISNPAVISKQGSYVTAGSLRGLSISGKHGFLIEGEGHFVIIDVAERSGPELLGIFAAPGYLVDMAVSGNHAYLVQQPRWTGSGLVNGGLLVVGIDNPAAPVLVSTYPSSGQMPKAVEILGPYVYFLEADRFQSTVHIIDVTSPGNPRRVGSRTFHFAANSISASGNHLLLSSAQGAVVILHQYQPIRFNAMTFGPNGNLRMRVSGPPGVPTWLQHSSDLNVWEDLLPITFDGSTVEIDQATGSSAEKTFYRLKVQAP